MTPSTRFYIVRDDNASWICDGTTGQCVESEPHGLYRGETVQIRDWRLECLGNRCATLNRDDYASRRQFGESRAAFATRSAA